MKIVGFHAGAGRGVGSSSAISRKISWKGDAAAM
jgi:hypothetical protein